ncbi:hypothetical protein VE02_07985 [Pseudogymnoascus sp. 03VT05]|nr:hypothetical protein VE02_07985 [Pseudogymnoascus sp. 03VT05]
MSTSGYPPGWEADYDGETERWFYTHKPTGVRQYHFPKAGDEVELAAAMSRTKAADEPKSKESNTAQSSKDLATTKVTPGTKSQALDQSPTIKRSVSERATPTSPQPIPNAFKQSFQAAQRTDAATAQQTSPAALPPLNKQLHSTSRAPVQVASSAHPLRINTNALNQGGNASPVQSMSAGPWNQPTSKTSGVGYSGRGAPQFSQGSQRTPGSSTRVASEPPAVPPKVLKSDRAPSAGSKHLGQTHSHSSSVPVPHDNAGEVICSRLGILYFSDTDKEDVITNLQNLARMYPDVTLSQLVDPHMELPRAKVPNQPSSSQEPSRQGGKRNARDTSPAPASAISADASLPIAFVAYSREPQPTQMTYSPPVAGPNPSFGAPSSGSSFDYQRHQHSSSNASITSTAIQTSHDRTHSSSISSKRQDSTGTQTYSPQTRSELAQAPWGLKPASASTEGPELATGILVRPATTAPIQAVESSPDALGGRPSRQLSVSRKPLSSQSPIMNRPYQSMSWQPRDHSPNPQLPSSLVSEVPEEPSTPPPDVAEQGSSLVSTSSKVYSEEAPLRPTTPPEQQSQEKTETEQKELDRLNTIIIEQNKELALLYQQNIQRLQNLQNQKNATVSHQRHSSVPVSQATRSSVYTQSSLQNAHYPPSYPSVPVSPISRPESLVYSIQEEQPRPLSLPEPAFDTAASKPGDIERISEDSGLPIDEFEDNASTAGDVTQHFENQPDQAPMFECNIAQDNIEEESGVDDEEVIGYQPADTTNELNMAATCVGDRSESRGSNHTESKRGPWSHVRVHSATQQIPDQNILQTNTSVRDRSKSPGSNHTETKRGPWSHERTHSAAQQMPDQTIHQIEVTDVSIPPATSTGVQAADLLVTQETSNVPLQTYHQEPRQISNREPQQQDNVTTQEIHLPSHQRHSSQPRVELQRQQHYIAQATPASQSQPQSAQSYHIPNTMSQSAVHEINLQNTLEAQIQQHLEAVVSPQSAVSPPDPADSFYGVNSDSAVSDLSTPGLFHKEYFDTASVQHSQVSAIAQRRISIAEVVGPAQGHARKPSLPKPPVAEGPKYYEEKQVFFPAHAPLKIGSVQNTGLQNEVFAEQKPPVPEKIAEISTGPSPSRPDINLSPKPAAASDLPIQCVAFTRSKGTEAASTANVPPESKLLTANSPADTNTNTNQTHTTNSSRPRVSSWSEMAKPSYPPQPTFTFDMPGNKQDDAAAAESLYDGDGYGDYDDYTDDGPAPPRFGTPQPQLLQVRRSS